MLVAERVNSLEGPYYEPLEGSTNRRMRRSVAVPALYIRTSTKKVRAYGELPRYLIASQDSSTVTVGPYDANDPQACFKMHSFQLLSTSPEGGNVVIIETHDGRYITKDPNDSQAVKLMDGNEPQQTDSLDDRFFRIYQSPGDQYAHLKHIQSGTYLSTSQSGVCLHSPSGDLPDSTLFKEFDCTHT